MAKKNDKNIVTLFTVDQSALDKYPNRYLGVIKEFVKDENNLDEMMGAVAIINSKILPLVMSDKIPTKIRDDIIEAWQYVEPKMMTTKKNQKKILENWGGDMPLLFKVGAVLNYEKNKERIDFEYTLLNEQQHQLFVKIMSAMWNVHEKRRISCGTLSINLSKRMRKDEKEQYHYFVKDVINTFLLSEQDVLIFAIEKSEGDIISALVNKNNEIRIVPPEILKWSYSRDAITGEQIGNPEGEQYVEFNIEL